MRSAPAGSLRAGNLGMVPISLTTPTALDAGTRAQVTVLADAVAARDGAPPLNEQTLLGLDSTDVAHVLAYDEGTLVGYAQRDGDTAELAADAGHAGPLLAAVEAARPGPLSVWSHGHRSVLQAALEQRGYRRARVLHQLRRGMREPWPDAALPSGITVRGFVPGGDEQDWLRVNAAAFADHPEQGGWTGDDLAAREAEAWFDPDGFLLAHRADRLVGFHWTKIHPDGAGEVYVIGVDPSAQGLHLGPALLALGLNHLRDRGCEYVLLYVDDTNSSAMRLYDRFGFTRYDVDVQWQASGH